MKATLSLIAALALPICLSAQPPSDTSTGISTAGLYSLELEIITREQIEAYQHGTPASAITLATGETLEDFLAGGIPKFELCEANIDTGGDLSGGGPFVLENQIGKSLVGVVAGGPFELRVGAAGDLGTGFPIFEDGFEQQDLCAWDAQTPPANCP